MKEFLQTLLVSLNNLTVKGKDNIDILLGCMMAVEKAIAQLDAPELAQENEVEDGR